MFALLWEDGQSGALAAAPTTRRGPRYTITWTFPNGDGGEDLVRQSVWPYAAGGPVTFMAPGQKVLDGTSKGGWYRAGDNLRQDLVTLGLPDRQPLATPKPATPSPAADPGLGRPVPGRLALGRGRHGRAGRRGRRHAGAAPLRGPGRLLGALEQAVLVAVGVAELGPAAPGLLGRGSVNSTPRRRSSSKVAWMSSQANTSPGVNGTSDVSAPAGATSTQRPSSPIGSSRRFTKPSLPT